MKLEPPESVRASELVTAANRNREYPGSAHEPGRVGDEDPPIQRSIVPSFKWSRMPGLAGKLHARSLPTCRENGKRGHLREEWRWGAAVDNALS